MNEEKLPSDLKAAGAMNKSEINISLFILATVFFIIGFISWVNAILIPYFKIAFSLSNFQAYFVTFAFYISYLVISVPSSFLLKRTGFKKGMMFGFWFMAVGAFLFVPAARARLYEVFLLGLFALGTGLAILQTAVNPYITILGPKERAAQRISIVGICNKAAGILAPILFASVILKTNDRELFSLLPHMAAVEKNTALGELLSRVILPYSFVGLLLFGLGLLIRYSPLPEIDTEHESAVVATANSGRNNIFQFPHLILAALAIFLHVGTQVIAIDTVTNYAISMHMNLLEAKSFPSYTLTCTICGYILGIVLIPRWLSQVHALRFCTLLGLIFSILVILIDRPVFFLGHQANMSIWFVVLLGLSNSLIWAGIWPLALEGLGRFTKIGSSIMIMGLCGNAILPLFYGYFADRYSLRTAYVVLIPCYLYLIFFAFQGYRIKKWSYKNIIKPEL